MTRGLLVKTDKTFEYINTNGYKDIQRAVDGFIEAVSFGENSYFCYINEEGKLTGLEVNELATSLWYDSGERIMLGDFIAGDAVFFGGVDSNGNDVDIPQDFADVFRKYLAF